MVRIPLLRGQWHTSTDEQARDQLRYCDRSTLRSGLMIPHTGKQFSGTGRVEPLFDTELVGYAQQMQPCFNFSRFSAVG